MYVPIQVKQHRIEVYFCNACQAEFVDHKYDYGFVINLYTLVNEKMYKWSLLQDVDGYAGTLWYIGEPGEPGVRPNRKVKMLKHLDFDPLITPENVQRKIEMMLVFL